MTSNFLVTHNNRTGVGGSWAKEIDIWFDWCVILYSRTRTRARKGNR
ncbi:hypothetical protein [Streptomyces sp. CRN 30]|nr:hypothetical protein [Streptomyces sp. CRN 30]